MEGWGGGGVLPPATAKQTQTVTHMQPTKASALPICFGINASEHKFSFGSSLTRFQADSMLRSLEDNTADSDAVRQEGDSVTTLEPCGGTNKPNEKYLGFSRSFKKGLDGIR